MTIYVHQNKYRKNFARFQKLTSSSSKWAEKKTEKVWICESVGKLKGVGQQEKAKMNELIIHTIADLQLHVRRHGIPKVHI